MAPPNPKSPPRPRVVARSEPRRRPETVELPFDPPRATRRRADEEAIETAVYEVASDAELSSKWGAEPLPDPGYKPAYLYVEKGPGQGQLLPVNQGALVIGRASLSELRLQHASVSRRHAQLTRIGERFYLKDLASQNGTFVNRVRLESEVEVFPGDLLTVGSAVLKLRGPTDRIDADVQRQIRKVSSTKRPAPPRRAQQSNVVAVAIACVAIGFGLAAVAFAALRFLEPVSAPPPAQIATGNHPLPQSAGDHAEAPLPTPTSLEVEPTALTQPDPVEASASAIARAERKNASKPASSRRTRTVAATRKEAAPSTGSSSATILARYEEGDLAGAVSLARSAADADLLDKLTEFQTVYEAGQRAEAAGDGTAAIKSYQRALELDEKLSGGWGKFGPVISNKLGQLYVLVGRYYVAQSDPQNARLAFTAALKYAPDNADAKKGLGELQPPETRKAAIADAWEEPEVKKPAPTPAPANAPSRTERASAIEDAWND